jgi:ribose 5-phosphate isomerase RpiB|tara:strand:+ start:111 stop:302 length:192 start_codon:yes stop_codon:yes gene_type:complete
MTNSNQITSVKDLQIIRNYLTDAQWDVVDMALNEFQDHDDYVEILDSIGDKLQTVFDKTTEEN